MNSHEMQEAFASDTHQRRGRAIIAELNDISIRLTKMGIEHEFAVDMDALLNRKD